MEPTQTPTIIPTPTLEPTATEIPCVHDGDVNGDGQVTPGDAQLAFYFYLSCVANDPTTEQYCAADFCGDGAIEPCDNSVTPSDAQGIMRFYLGYATPCTKRGGDGTTEAGEVRIELLPGASPGQVWAEVRLSGSAAPVSAFGLEIHFDAERMTFNTAGPGLLDPGWIMFAARESEPGIVTVGAFSLDAVSAGSAGSLARLEFVCRDQALAGPLTMEAEALADDLAGCTVIRDQLLSAAAGIAPAIGGTTE